ncbi:MAG: hypothetical protein R3F43_10820 [bacterium]
MAVAVAPRWRLTWVARAARVARVARAAVPAGPAARAARGRQVEQPLARVPGRMAIEQLARSIPVVTGGLRWTEDFGQRAHRHAGGAGPHPRGAGLPARDPGEPQPTLIVAKFIQDAAFRICGQWAQQDRQAAAGDRTLVREGDWDSLEAAHVRANLRALQLRFYARAVTPDDDAPIADLGGAVRERQQHRPGGARRPGRLDGGVHRDDDRPRVHSVLGGPTMNRRDARGAAGGATRRDFLLRTASQPAR